MNDPLAAAVDDALARAVVYRTLSIGFQAPTDERLRQVGALEGFGVVATALRCLDQRDRTVHRVPLPPSHEASASAEASADRGSLGGGGQADPGPLEQSADRLASMSLPGVETLVDDFVRLFGHTTRGLVCACETEYGPDNGFHQPQQLADLSGYYLAFGLRPALASDVRADHIACECEFMDFLSRKEALLLAGGARGPSDEETLAVTRQAARTFLRDHLGRFGRAFAARVATEDAGGYFGTWGHILLAFVYAECMKAGVNGGPIDLTVQPESIDETPMACGSVDDLIQIERHPRESGVGRSGPHARPSRGSGQSPD